MRGSFLVAAILLLVGCTWLAARTPQQPAGSGAQDAPARDAPVPNARSSAPPRDAVGRLRFGASVIRGRVVALDTGQPLRRAQVALGILGIRQSRAVMTDDQGRFEIADLPAAQYYINATKEGYLGLYYGQRRPTEPRRPLDLAAGTSVDDLIFRLPRGGAIAGYVVDQFGDPVVGARVQILRQRYVAGQPELMAEASTGLGPGTDDRGAFRLFGLAPGEYVVRASLQGMLVTGNESTTVEFARSYVPTYYPGTVFATLAQPVVVSMSEEVTGLIVPLLAARAATVSGVVVDAAGRPYPGMRLTVRDGSSSRGMFTSGPDGAFTIRGLAPGEYSLDARAPVTDPGDPARSDVGSVEVVIADGDVSGLVVAATPGVTIRGRIVAASGGPPEGIAASDVRIATRSIPSAAPFGNGVLTVNADWTFEMAHVQGRRLLSATVPPDWAVRRILLDGRDVIDTPLDFARSDVDGLVIELTREIASLSGIVRGAQGAPTDDAVVVVFSADPDRWAPPSRFVRTVRPDEQGSFETRGLPPGPYLAVAVEYVEYASPSMLERLRWSGAAVPVSLREGESPSVELQVVESF